MFGEGFLGTRADFLMDFVVTSLVIVLPVSFWSLYSVRYKKKYAQHRNIQTTLGIVLFVVVSVFEYDLRSHGGAMQLSEGSSLTGTAWIPISVYTHLFISSLTGFIWALLIIFSWIKFARPPEPNSFSRFHRFWGPIAFWGMILTGITGVELYVVSMVF